MTDKTKSPWWKKAVIYQIYPRSFQDSNDDGIGDIPGIIKRLPYLNTLGINAIWLSPVYRSPQDDNGYDISDYQNIEPVFGTLADMDTLIAEANKYDIRIIMDLVLNHSSDEHFWFKEAVKSKDNPYHDYYVWRDGNPDAPPNDMRACFGGSSWEWVPSLNQYYFHQFSVKQPDLNWENPALRKELYDMILWWVKRGVGGFRLDVIDQIAKEPDRKITNNGPRLHEFIRELSKEAFAPGSIYGDSLITVGEAWGANTDNAKLYSSPDGSEFSMVFQFEHIGLDQQEGKEKWDLKPLDFVRLKDILSKWQTALHGQGWNSLFFDNHDLPRVVSRFGDDSEKYRECSAKMLALVLHGMQGTPYIYQGEELGMTNIKYELSDYRDIETLNMVKERMQKGYEHSDIMNSIYAKGRDNARTPMQWDNSAFAGFSGIEPWIKVNPNYTAINAGEQLSRAGSVFHFYKKLITLRKEYELFAEGDFTLLLKDHPSLFAYLRSYDNKTLLVLANFSKEEVSDCHLYKDLLEGTDAKLLLSNYGTEWKGQNLQAYEAMMILI